MAHPFLTIEQGQLVAYTSGAPNGRFIGTLRELHDVLALGEVFASSSLDFAEEYTSDPAVLVLAAEVRRLTQ